MMGLHKDFVLVGERDEIYNLDNVTLRDAIQIMSDCHKGIWERLSKR